MLLVYLIIFEYFNKKVRTNLKKNIQTNTSLIAANEQLNTIDCNATRIYCVEDSNCAQLCANTIDKQFEVEYKCGEANVCTQSPLVTGSDQRPEVCNRNFGFLPILVADEIFEPRWTCLNTQPYLFNEQQQYHAYICAGGDRSKLDPKNVFESCVCAQDCIKARDDLRNDIPICIPKRQLSLFPNFTYSEE